MPDQPPIETPPKPRARPPGEYSDWQTERLRDRLMAYYCERAKKRGVTGWINVASDVFGHEDIVCYMDTSQVKPVDALGESLRRYSRREQIPDDDRLYVIRLFLERAGYLTPVELDQASSAYHAAYGLMDHFAAGEDEIAAAAALQGIFLACRPVRNGFQVTAWRIEVGAKPGLMTVKEHSAVYPGQLSRQWPDVSPDIYGKHPLTQGSSDGWMSCAGGATFTVFLRDRHSESNCQYVLVGMSTDTEPPALIVQRHDGVLETDFRDCLGSEREASMLGKIQPVLRAQLRIFWKQ